MNKYLKLAMGLISIIISCNYYAGYWVVGSVFGVAYLGMNYDQLKKTLFLKYVLFFLASILTYALVYRIAEHGFNLDPDVRGWRFKSDVLDALFGPLSVGVVMGSLLLPFVQGILFPISTKRIRKGWFCLIGSWYLTIVFSLISENLKLPESFNFITIAIVLWQSAYFMIFNAALSPSER